MTNALSTQTSPYLLQHVNNPVNWYPWGQEALDRAREENKLIVLSIGYSACHWCHVMEHESFEDEGVAAIMNEHFISIKIDREERPDIDQVYMLAVQLMTGSGGWPLNCICLPDQRPVYGGTYFRTVDWKNLLLNLAGLWRHKPEEAINYAERLTQGIRSAEHPIHAEEQPGISIQEMSSLTTVWKRLLDPTEGGYARAPKFPLPNTWQFMMRYAHLSGDEAARILTRLTLEKMAHGGIYDHIGGGFARYSVDGHWHVPHFEKMLYDNAQLISLYSEAWQWEKIALFKEVVYESAGWLLREMRSPMYGFYAALDADSEGVEGKFYTFSKEELEKLLAKDAPLFCEWFHVSDKGNWEEESTNVFFRRDDEEDIADRFGLTLAELHEKIEQLKSRVFREREQRIRPGLDDKILASWNGMALKGLTDAFKAFNDPLFLDAAVANANFVLGHLVNAQGEVRRSFAAAGKAHIPGFLDDYAFLADGLIGLYEVTLDERYLHEARKLILQAIRLFHDEASGLFYYTPSDGEQLIARKFEITDNVMPSSNSVMAHNLRKLGLFYADDAWLKLSRRMVSAVAESLSKYPSSYSNWATLQLWELYGTWELAVTGPAAERFRTEIEERYIPNKIMLGGTSGTLPLLAGKMNGDDRIFVCRNRTCLLPAATTEQAFQELLALQNNRKYEN